MPTIPDNTAVRTALWRALHIEIDASPPVFNDTVALALAAPEPNWRERGDMHKQGTRRMRASIVARARFVEDTVEAEAAKGVSQYIILGAGLDTFAERRIDLSARLTVYEIDQPETQAWKRQRLIDLGYGEPAHLRFAPVNFETDPDWRAALARAGFDAARPAIIASTGVAMYLTRDANLATLRDIASFAPGSTLVLSFLSRPDLLDEEDRRGLEMAQKGAAAAGTPFLSFFAPDEIVQLARGAGFKQVEHVSCATLTARYFANRSDGLAPSNGEELIVART